MRLIDAEAAKLLTEEYYPFVEGCAEVGDVKDFLDCCHTIEAKPIVHAHWNEVREGLHVCSNCQVKASLTSDEYDYMENLSDYCPWCGAQMNEVTE
jgi:uncharacterized CHY-type Zn-finger protein